jgi:hypothetical protein
MSTLRASATGSVRSKDPVSGTISLAADLAGVNKGASFAIAVIIETGGILRGAQWSLKFDPGLMKCASFEEGSFFKDWAAANNGSSLVFPQPAIDNQNGTVSDAGIAIVSRDSGGVTGRGVAGIYRFTALSDSLKMPGLQKAQGADEKGNMSNLQVK